MGLNYDHLIFWVQDPDRLDAVCRGFEAAGFTITDRPDAGRATGATRQRLICFQDGSYVEILTVRDPKARAAHRLEPAGRLGDGWLDYSVVVRDLTSSIAAARAAGLPISGPKSHEKRLEDGRLWGVRLINIGRGVGHPALPFFLEDTAGRALRIPMQANRHANGVTGTLGARLVVGDLDRAARDLTVMLGTPIDPSEVPEGAARGARFAIGDQWVDLFEPAPDPSPLARLHALRGDSLYAAVLRGPHGAVLDLSDAGPFTETEIRPG